MEKALNKIKAATKILVGAILTSIIGSIASIIIVLMTRAGTLSLVLGALIMLGSVALGAFIGGKWARVNVAALESAKGIAIGSAIIYAIAGFAISVAGNVLSAMLDSAGADFRIQAAQISAQSFAIYTASRLAMKQPLSKKEMVK